MEWFVDITLWIIFDPFPNQTFCFKIFVKRKKRVSKKLPCGLRVLHYYMTALLQVINYFRLCRYSRDILGFSSPVQDLIYFIRLAPRVPLVICSYPTCMYSSARKWLLGYTLSSCYLLPVLVILIHVRIKLLCPYLKKENQIRALQNIITLAFLPVITVAVMWTVRNI